MNVVLEPYGMFPTRAHEKDGGLDLYATKEAIVPGRGKAVFDTGIRVQLPEGTIGKVESKSGLFFKYGLITTGVIDVGYTGTVKVALYNLTDNDYLVGEGDKIAQLVIMPVLFPELNIVDELEVTDRGANGFGSSGK